MTTTEEATAKLMKFFYERLLDGRTVLRALADCRDFSYTLSRAANRNACGMLGYKGLLDELRDRLISTVEHKS